MNCVRSRVRSILTVFSSGLFITSCSSEFSQQLPAYNLTVNGVERTYNLFVPTNTSSTAMPLLLAAHGGGGRGFTFPQQNRFEQLAEQEGFLIAFPQAKLLPGNEGEWQLNTKDESRQDMDYIEAVIDDIGSRHAVDSTRVYATGYSLGSMFTYELACQLSSRFAAIASFAGTMPVSPSSCTPQIKVPIMHIHGFEDGIISYEETWGWKSWDDVGTMMDIPSLVQFWKDKYNCENESQMNSESSQHIVHDICDDNVRVEHHRLDNVGHSWPESVNGRSTHEVIWTFLNEFSRS